MGRRSMNNLINQETIAAFALFGWLTASAYVIGSVVLDVLR